MIYIESQSYNICLYMSFLYASIFLFVYYFSIEDNCKAPIKIIVLMLMHISISGYFFIIFGAKFLALVLINIYSGGLLVLTLYAILFTDSNNKNQNIGRNTMYKKYSSCIVLILYSILVIYLINDFTLVIKYISTDITLNTNKSTSVLVNSDINSSQVKQIAYYIFEGPDHLWLYLVGFLIVSLYIIAQYSENY